VGVAITEDIRQAIADASQWIPALHTAGEVRDGAQIVELIGLIPNHNYPSGTRFIVRREHPTWALNCPCSTPSKACVTRSSPPTPRSGTDRSSTWKPATAHTPASKTVSAYPSMAFAVGSNNEGRTVVRPSLLVPAPAAANCGG
jgi:hypothetical protein